MFSHVLLIRAYHYHVVFDFLPCFVNCPLHYPTTSLSIPQDHILTTGAQEFERMSGSQQNRMWSRNLTPSSINASSDRHSQHQHQQQHHQHQQQQQQQSQQQQLSQQHASQAISDFSWMSQSQSTMDIYGAMGVNSQDIRVREC